MLTSGLLCSLLEVAPADGSIAAPVAAVLQGEGLELPRGALVVAGGTCADGSVSVELLAAPTWVGPSLEAPPVGSLGCVAEEALRPPPELFLVAEDAWPLRRGELVALGGICEAWTVRGFALSRTSLATLRPMWPEMVRDARRVQGAYEAHFGPLNLADVPVTETGFVGLPIPHALSGSAHQAELLRERLDTQDRQRGALRWYGGDIDGRPAYAHFLGGDAAYSDIWARPETVLRVLDLAAGWARACPHATSAPETCLLQLGDLAWFDDVVPDPLGHKDHHAGLCMDVRLFRDDGSRYEAWWSQPDDRPGVSGGYDRQLTLDFLSWVIDHFPVSTILFNDPVARRQLPQVRRAPKHDEHIHLCF